MSDAVCICYAMNRSRLITYWKLKPGICFFQQSLASLHRDPMVFDLQNMLLELVRTTKATAARAGVLT